MERDDNERAGSDGCAHLTTKEMQCGTDERGQFSCKGIEKVFRQCRGKAQARFPRLPVICAFMIRGRYRNWSALQKSRATVPP